MHRRRAHAEPQMTRIPAAVTICITSCGRFDLLTQTMDTFRRFNLSGTILLSEDSGDTAVIQAIAAQYPDVRILSGSTRLGLMGSVDRLYAQVEMPFIFHIEDDWEFDGPVAWEAAIQALEEHPDISNVCLRDFNEIRPKFRTAR
jgi:hypothetical protein